MKKVLAGALAVVTVYLGFVYGSTKPLAQDAARFPEDYELGV